MENLALPTQPTTAAPGGAAAPVAAPAAPAAPVAAPMYDAGGMPAAAPKTGWFEGVSIVDIGMFALVSLALFYSIYYHRSMILNAKVWKANQQNELDEVKSNVQAFLGPDYKSFS